MSHFLYSLLAQIIPNIPHAPILSQDQNYLLLNYKSAISINPTPNALNEYPSPQNYYHLSLSLNNPLLNLKNRKLSPLSSILSLSSLSENHNFYTLYNDFRPRSNSHPNNKNPYNKLSNLFFPQKLKKKKKHIYYENFYYF
jgi:hypothetical protein